MPSSYAVASDRRGMIPWAHVNTCLTHSHNYWVSTCATDGKPHAMPVWGLWIEGVFYFSTDRTSRKGRNLAANPRIVVHLESGDDVVILEGQAKEVTAKSEVPRIDKAYSKKYGMMVSTIPGDVGIYSIRPKVVLAWRERDFNKSATKWVL